MLDLLQTVMMLYSIARGNGLRIVCIDVCTNDASLMNTEQPTVIDLISGQSALTTNLASPPKKNCSLFFKSDLISGPSTSGHVWPSGLYLVNLYCLHESHLK